MAKMNLKSLVAVAALAIVAVQANAATSACTGVATKNAINAGSGATSPSSTGFLQQGFDFQCSQNVYVSYNEDNTTQLSVGSLSVKGNQYFGGNSNGGAIRVISKCSADPCPSSDVGTAVTAASTM